MKKLAVAIMLGLGTIVGGCGHSDDVGQANNQTQTQTQQVNDGISLGRAIEQAKNGEFKPQKVKFEGNISNKVFGDEPEIIVTTFYNMGGQNKMVHIHVTDPEVINRVAKLQEQRKNNFVRGTGSINATEINIENWKIEVK